MRAVADRSASLDPDGKEIREYVSEEYMRQFVSPQGLYVELVQKSELAKGIDQIIESFLDKRLGRE